MNVIVDKLAKIILVVAIEDDSFISSTFLFEKVRVLCQYRKVTESLRLSLKQHWINALSRSTQVHTCQHTLSIGMSLIWYSGMGWRLPHAQFSKDVQNICYETDVKILWYESTRVLDGLIYHQLLSNLWAAS